MNTSRLENCRHCDQPVPADELLHGKCFTCRQHVPVVQPARNLGHAAAESIRRRFPRHTRRG